MVIPNGPPRQHLNEARRGPAEAELTPHRFREEKRSSLREKCALIV